MWSFRKAFSCSGSHISVPDDCLSNSLHSRTWVLNPAFSISNTWQVRRNIFRNINNLKYWARFYKYVVRMIIRISLYIFALKRRIQSWTCACQCEHCRYNLWFPLSKLLLSKPHVMFPKNWWALLWEALELSAEVLDCIPRVFPCLIFRGA